MRDILEGLFVIVGSCALARLMWLALAQHTREVEMMRKERGDREWWHG